MEKKVIKLIGARHHNLKDLEVEIPRQALVVITGVSGSGKSTLAFDIIFAEGQRRYLESLPAYVRQFLKLYEQPEVDLITGLPPTVAIEQRTSQAGPRSTVGTLTEIYHYLRLLYARLGQPRCPQCGRPLSLARLEDLVQLVKEHFAGAEVMILAPKVRRRKGFHRPLFEAALRAGRPFVRVDGRLLEIPPLPELSRFREHTIEIGLGRIKVSSKEGLARLLEEALEEGKGEALVLSPEEELLLSSRAFCPACNQFLPQPDPLLFSFNTKAGACPRCEGLGRIGEGEECPVCGGSRLRPEARAFYIDNLDIASLCALPAEEILDFLDHLCFQGRQAQIAAPILKEAQAKLAFLCEVGLGYLSLDRAGDTLSGGEAQRVRLAAQLGSNLTGVCYVLDEPTIGLHPRDNRLLIKALRQLQEKGNTVIVVEHDEETMRAADWIIDLGPGGGQKGGEIVFAGDFEALLKAQGSATATALKDTQRYRLLPPKRQPETYLTLKGARFRNLKGLDVAIPWPSLTVVTGVSGSGKSTLIMEILYENLQRVLHGRKELFHLQELTLPEGLNRAVVVDHTPIGRTPRSTPATYVGLMTRIRALFAALPEARAKGFGPGRFSFNVAEGRCEACKGQGQLRVEMKFLPEVYVTCEMCGGKRYNEETLLVRYRGKTIADVLAMTMAEAREFFARVPSLAEPLEVLCNLGLDYLTLGQPSPTLSGGEAQRIKLAAEFIKGRRPGTIFILDEPTTGLHLADVAKLLELLHNLVERGHTVVVIEHHLDVIKEADWIIDLGPGGGPKGGELLFQGSPEELLAQNTPTAQALREFLAQGEMYA